MRRLAGGWAADNGTAGRPVGGGDRGLPAVFNSSCRYGNSNNV